MKAQKIDGTTLKAFKMVIVAFSIHDKARKVCFFKETFLLADIRIDMALGMSFLFLSNADVHFTDWELHWKSYSVFKALPTTCHVELINQKDFAAAALGKNNKAFIVYIASLAVSTKMTIHSSQTASIISFIIDKALVTISLEYSDFANVFSYESVAKLPEHTGINNHPIKLIDNRQPSYRPIYSWELIEMETLKIYIESNLANGFIRPSKSPATALILFD